MGLDVTHNCWHSSYSHFAEWRDALASAAGLGSQLSAMMIAGIPSDANLAGDWDETPFDPLVVLMAHLDYDGHITPRDAAPLAARLNELLPKLSKEDVATTRQFIAGLKKAAKAGETVEFY
jgi:hypothetical protein